MADPGRDERLQIMLTPEEIKALDDWRFSHRMPSRASAVRELLRRGLAAEGFDTAGRGKRSRDFGVMRDGAKDGQPLNGAEMDGVEDEGGDPGARALHARRDGDGLDGAGEG